MFKNTILRQARLCRAPRAVAVSALASRTTLRAAPIYTRLAATHNSATLQYAKRLYSSEAAVSQEAPADATGEEAAVSKFADLSALGVDDTIVHAITKDMGYENMTDVQALTINPALEGKDM